MVWMEVGERGLRQNTTMLMKSCPSSSSFSAVGGADSRNRRQVGKTVRIVEMMVLVDGRRRLDA